MALMNRRNRPARRRSSWPVGTRAELEKNPMWRLDEWPTCGVGDRANGVLPCPKASECPFVGGRVFDHDVPPMKGVSGPKNLGLQIIDSDVATGKTKVVNTVQECYLALKTVNRIEARGGLVRIIGLEGDEIEEMGSELQVIEIPGQPKSAIYKRVVKKRVIPAFPRPENNPALADNAFVAMQAERHAESRRAEAADEAFGFSPSSPKKESKGGPRG